MICVKYHPSQIILTYDCKKKKKSYLTLAMWIYLHKFYSLDCWSEIYVTRIGLVVAEVACRNLRLYNIFSKMKQFLRSLSVLKTCWTIECFHDLHSSASLVISVLYSISSFLRSRFSSSLPLLPVIQTQPEAFCCLVSTLSNFKSYSLYQ